MTTLLNIEPRQGAGQGLVLAALLAGLLSGCGGGDGPAIEARAQAVQFNLTAATLTLPGTATVSASASSGLAVAYSSTTPGVCAVDKSTGQVTSVAAGTCTIAADQSGNSSFAPAPQVRQDLSVLAQAAQTLAFGAAPVLVLFGTATVLATASSGLAVRYTSLSPGVCSVDAGSGLVTDLAAGDCRIAADQDGDAGHDPAPQQVQTLTVALPPPLASVPGVPGAVSASAGAGANTVLVSIGATDSGGSRITGYRVVSSPAGLSASAAASPVLVSCPAGCAGYAFAAQALNGVGDGALSAAVEVVTDYDVSLTFHEPDTQPRDSIFVGSFSFNATTRSVTKLRGRLSESMTGTLLAYPNDTMTWLTLNHQLSAVFDPALGGLLVTTFLLPTPQTLSTLGGGDGWAPGSGFGLYFGFPGAANPASGGVGNAYARIFVNAQDPTAAPTQAQLDTLAYADCTAGGMMGATCMTGTTVAGYGAIGTMSGFPVAQTISKKP